MAGSLNILIVGGTGFIGQALVKDRLGRDDTVTVLGRRDGKIKRLFGSSVHCLTWHTLKIDDIKPFDVIINLSGANIAAKRWTSKRKANILRSRLQSTKILAQYCAELGNNAPSLLNASAVGVYGVVETISTSVAINENTPIDFHIYTDFSSEVARRWELASEVARRHRVRVVDMRFGVVLGLGGGMLKKLVPSYRLGLGAVIATGQQAISWVALQDVIAAIDFLLQRTDVQGAVNIVAPECVSQQTFAKTLARILHRPCWLRIPAWCLKLLLGRMASELLIGGQRVYPQRLRDFDFQFKTPSLLSTLNAELGVKY